MFPQKLFVAKLAQHFEKLAQQILWEWVKEDAFSWQFSQFSAKANDFGARIPREEPNFVNLVEMAQVQKPYSENTGANY